MPVPMPTSDARTPVLDHVRMLASLDQDFRSRLLSDPAATLSSEGMEIPEGLKVNVVEDDFETFTLTIPPFVGRNIEVEAFAAVGPTQWAPACGLCIITTPICTLGTWTSFLGIAAKP